MANAKVVLSSNSHSELTIDNGYTIIHNFSAIDASALQPGDKIVDLESKSAITIDSVEVSSTNDTVKRANCPSTTVKYTQHQVAQHGTWWSQWEQATGKLYCGQDPAGGQLTTGIEWTIGYGIAIDAGISIEDVIGAMLGIGISIEKSTTNTCSVSCNCANDNQPCVWEQSLLTWSDTQKQSCERFSNCEGGYVTCGAWSAYQRTNAPYKDASCGSYNFGCSTGSGCNYS